MSTHRFDGPVFDADNHFYETRDALTRYLPKRYQNAIRFVEVDGRTKIAINGQISDYIPNPTFDVVARPGTHLDFYKGTNPEGKTMREMTGDPMRSIDAFRAPEPRLALLDELGIYASLMFPTLASLVEERMSHDPEMTHAVIHALNEWMHADWSFDYRGRIFSVPVITLPIVERAIEELNWVLERGARTVLIRPAPVPGYKGSRSFGLPEFDPFWQRVQDTGVLVCLHSSDTGYNKYLETWEGGEEFLPFKPNPFRDVVQAKRPIEDAVSALVCHGAMSRFPDVKIGLIENGATWIPHLMDQFDLTYRRMPKEFMEHPVETFQRNFWVNPFGEDDVKQVLDFVAPEKLLFGSDYPHPEGLADPVRFADNLPETLPAHQVAGIMGGNLAGLLGVDLPKVA
ncbi:MAG: amidohydrolase 2 [Acidimicrobiia bacterium]|nr:amidohydrolase 2 [Acidimicrobiia bacterium]